MVAPSAAAAVASVGRLCEGLAFLCGAVDKVAARTQKGPKTHKMCLESNAAIK